MPSTLGRTFTRVRDGLAWRVRQVFGDQFVDRTLVKIAQCWRPILKKPVFIGVTGSAEKTTEKDLLPGVLPLCQTQTPNLTSKSLTYDALM